jgi:hypothetical protein
MCIRLIAKPRLFPQYRRVEAIQVALCEPEVPLDAGNAALRRPTVGSATDAQSAAAVRTFRAAAFAPAQDPGGRGGHYR